MSDTVQFKNKNHRVGIADNGASVDWEPGEVLELPRAEAERMAKAGQGKIVDAKEAGKK